uniref:Putative secreted protein n=1 Tax=Anopheles darlingi TaxID=43151 RepID=A0A2M4DA08_ANODA
MSLSGGLFRSLVHFCIGVLCCVAWLVGRRRMSGSNKPLPPKRRSVLPSGNTTYTRTHTVVPPPLAPFLHAAATLEYLLDGGWLLKNPRSPTPPARVSYSTSHHTSTNQPTLMCGCDGGSCCCCC